MNLYQISQEYSSIIAKLYDDDTGEINPNALEMLQGNEIALEKKAIALASWIKNMDVEAEAIKAARDNMMKREKLLHSRIDAWKDHLKNEMERRGINEITCPYFALKVKKNPPSTLITDESLITHEYLEIVTETKIKRSKILSELKLGVDIPGAELKQGTSLSIK